VSGANGAGSDFVADIFDVALPARPYPGLRPFAKKEWPIFFGRERMVDEVIERLIEQRFLVVHGDSGCGKSSLIRAGVLPRLEQDCARGGAQWITCVTAPGDAPLANLAGALVGLIDTEHIETRTLDLRRILNTGRDGAAALADFVCTRPEQHVCLLIDQFEEIFAHARRHGTQQASLLVDLLIGLQSLAAPRLSVVLTMRSEFLGVCAQFDGFAETVNRTQYLLPRMEHADLVRAIREPAYLYDGEIAPELANRLIADGGNGQDQLPLIQHGLMLLHRDCVVNADGSWRLTADSYRSPGTLGQLLSNHADEVMAAVESPDGSDTVSPGITEDVFRALTDINADGQAIRHPQNLKELIAVTNTSEADVRRVIDAFRAEGVSLLRPYGDDPIAFDDYVDISHEALIRCWARIADVRDGWVSREFKNGLVWRSLLVQADSFERDHSNVLSPATTEERRVWLRRRNAAWSERYDGGWDRVERLIAASEAARDQEIREAADKRARENDAKMEEGQANLREQLLKMNLAAALERGKFTELFGGALLISLGLLAIAGYSAYTAHRESAIAVDQRAKAEREAVKADLARQDLKIAADEAEAKRKAAEASLDDIRSQLAGLSRASDAAPANSAIKQTINQVETSIARQVTALSDATRLSPRIYLHIAEASQRDAARALELRIEAARIDDVALVVPGIQLVDAPPKDSLLRCFVADDCKRYGPRLVEVVNAALTSPKVVLQDFSKTYTPTGALRPQHFELYFAPGPITLAGQPPSAK
jgi:hypothetical protein